LQHFQHGGYGTAKELADKLGITEDDFHGYLQYIRRKYRLPLYSLDGIYKLWTDVDDLWPLAIRRSRKASRYFELGVDIVTRECIAAIEKKAKKLSPRKRDKLLHKAELLSRTALYLTSLVDDIAGRLPEESSLHE